MTILVEILKYFQGKEIVTCLNMIWLVKFNGFQPKKDDMEEQKATYVTSKTLMKIPLCGISLRATNMKFLLVSMSSIFRTVDGRNPANQLIGIVVHPMIYDRFLHPRW